MTFKHKLSRRLALLKDRTMVVSTALLAVATIVGCERPLTFTDPGTGTSSRLVLSPKILTLRQNQVADFTAVGLAATGDTATVAVSWSVTSGSITDTSTSNGKHYGRYKAGSDTGKVKVTATGNPGGSDTAVVTVTPVPVASVSVSPASVSAQVGQTVQLSATTKDSAGAVLTGRAVSWSSSNPSVASVSGSGLVTGLAAGSATLTATSEGQSGTAAIAVTTVPVASVAVTPASAGIQVGQTAQLTATPKDGSGNALSGRIVTWASSNASVATVNASGLATAVAAGSAMITATSEGQSGTSSITVTNVPVASVALTPASATIQVGQTQQLAATLKDASGNTLSGRAVSWSSSSPSVATVSGSGLVTGLATGSAAVTATSEGQSGTSSITVTTVPVASVAVTPASATIQVGQTQQLAATLKDASGNTLSGRAVSWSSSNSSVASVSSSGLVTGLAAGSAVITATSEGKSGTATLTVVAPPPPPGAPGAVTDLVVAGATDTSVALSFTEVSDGTGQPASYDVRFAVAPISWGSATAVARGTCATPLAGSAIGAKRTCTVLGLSASTTFGFQLIAFRGTLNVDAVFGGLSNVATGTTAAGAPKPVASVTVSPATVSVGVGGTQQFTATLRDANGNVLSGRTVTWSSSSPAIATVSSTGLTSALLAGTTTVTATSEGQSGSAGLTVSALPPPPPSGTWANEPTGFTQYSDQPWSTLGSWALNDNVSGNASLVTLSGLPLSPSGALQYLFPTGMTGGGGGTGPGRADYYYPTGQQPTETYVGLWIKLGSPFQPHSSGVQKFLYLTDNNGAVFSALWFELYGGQAPLHLSLVNQFTGCPSIRIEPNATMTPINPGEWHKYEIYFKLASTGNASDGVVKVWVDGVLNVSLSNVCSLGRDSARLGRVALSAIWGGVGETKTENDYLWYDHTYVSGH